ncbi:MAG: Uma2 family endonuclease [Bryobacteraceae bacterium]
MSTVALISISEYLSTSYRSDVDYVDGEIKERNVGEWPHSRAQGLLTTFLTQRETQFGIRVVPEQCVQVSPTRFRIPDVCVQLRSDPFEPIVRFPPFLCIEILSRDDRASDLTERITDYLRMSVRFIWVIDPLARKTFIHTPGHMHEVTDGVLRTHDPEITVPLDAILETD